MPSNNCSFETTPLAQSVQPQPTVVHSLNYTCQEFWSLKTRLVDYIRQNFPDKFNDFVESDLAVMLIENQAFIADLLSFKIDQVANEPFLDTVTEVENAFRIAHMFGFYPCPPIASRSLWQATISAALTTELRVPAPMDIDIAADGQPMTIELFPADADNNPIFDQDIVIPAGNVTNTSIVGLEGKTFADESVSNGDVGQAVTLPVSPVLWDSVRVEVDGVRWRQVEYFTDSQRRLEYRVEFNSAWQAFVIFGNSRAGMVPSKGSRVRVTYRVGGGTRGNIVTGFVENQRVVPVDGFSYSIPVRLRNYTRGEFGYDGDTIEDIRRKLPAYLRTQNRGVTGNDYKTLADLFVTPYSGQVGKSTAVLRNHGCAGNVVDLYVLAKDTADSLVPAQGELKAALQQFIDERKMLTDFVCIRDGTVLIVDVSIDLTMDKFYRKFEDEMRERVTRRVAQFFSLNNWDYARPLKEAELIKALSDVKEISGLDINFVTNDAANGGSLVTAGYSEIIRPDQINLSFMYS